MANLYEQYTQAGQKLPSVQERQPLAQQAGIQNYAGTAEQNTALGNYITTNKIDLSKPIKMADITGTSGTLPQEKPDNTNYAGIMSGIQGGLVSQAEQQAKAQEVKANEMEQVVKNYFGSDNQPSSEDLLAQTRQGLGITEKEQKVNDLTAQLNQIVAESQAGQLQQEGRLASMGAISGAQRDIERQTAIRALPIQAQLSAAQGNLQTAQSNLETLFKLKSEDAERKYNRESEIRKFVYQYATDKEKRELDAQEKEADRKFEKDLADYKNELEQETLKFKAGLEGKTPTIPVGLTQEQQSDPFIAKLVASAGGKPLTDTFAQSLNKGLAVLSQIGVLQNNIKDVKTGPIVGAFKGANPWDTNAQTIKAQLNAIVPNLARGVYGEVGVLTDNDIKTYASTLPNLKSTEDIRNAVLGITVDLIGKGIKRTLEVNAANGKDVSGFIDMYTEMQNTRDSIFSQIPGYKGAGAKDNKVILENAGVTPEDSNIFSGVVGDTISQGSSNSQGFMNNLFNWLSGK
jgi:hypothetical protein